MKTDLLDYTLPEELIAQRPPPERDGGRMLTVQASGVEHGWVRDFSEKLLPGDLLVLNETRVRKARLFVCRPRAADGSGGGRVELLFLHPVGAGRWAALGKANRPLRAGDRLEGPGVILTVVERDEDGTLTIGVEGDLETTLERTGAMPIPPYMTRPSDASDDERYQTVFAKELGSAAAPTAGLHLTEAALGRIQARGVQLSRVTLHVGVGTFRPVTTEDLNDHAMHSEQIDVAPACVDAIHAARERGGRVVAVGTTVVRALESAASSPSGEIVACRKATNLLIQPGYQFQVVDALLTNFHQPRSTLLALVSAMTGRRRLMAAYEEAVRLRYRFLSYGDAMWIPDTRLASANDEPRDAPADSEPAP